MATRNVIEFAQRLETDAELRRKVEGVKATDKNTALAAVSRIASEAGITVSPADLEAGFAQFASGELGGADLDAVVGGVGAPQVSSSSAFVNALGKVMPTMVPRGGFLEPCV